MLTVMPQGRDPYQIQVGNPTPPKALPFLFAGSHVPVKIGTDPERRRHRLGRGGGRKLELTPGSS